MLRYLSIRNLAIVEELELQFDAGMTVLTGETGAGKSILLDALTLLLGEKASPSQIRPNCNQAEISATFDLSVLPGVRRWLNENSLDADEECIIRRLLNTDGRTRAYINGHPVTLTQLKQLSTFLLEIHGQYQNQTLLKPEYQCAILDEYAGHRALFDQMRHHYLEVVRIRKEMSELSQRQDQADRLALLNYQIQELEQLHLQENEIEQLEADFKQLNTVKDQQALCHNLLQRIKYQPHNNLIDLFQHALSDLSKMKPHTKALATAFDLLNQGFINTREALHELDTYSEKLIEEPAQLKKIEDRLNQIHTLARKHRIPPTQLFDKYQALKAEADNLNMVNDKIQVLQKALQEAEQQYYNAAALLSESRKTASHLLSQQIAQTLLTLEMPNGRFEVQCTQKAKQAITGNGIDEIEFLVSTNPGHPLQPLRKIASGGELSRISLAIQVITAEKMTIPTLIFDEVDTGISGKTAEIVGQLLRKLGQTTQVLCITHLPQVAAQGHHHYKVEKQHVQDTTVTTVYPLDNANKIRELARLLGGITITPQALAHAKSMLQNVA